MNENAEAFWKVACVFMVNETDFKQRAKWLYACNTWMMTQTFSKSSLNFTITACTSEVIVHVIKNIMVSKSESTAVTGAALTVRLSSRRFSKSYYKPISALVMDTLSIWHDRILIQILTS